MRDIEFSGKKIPKI